jgi:hypothetical protein
VKLKGCCLFLPHVARSLEKSRPKVAKELIEASSDAVADARQLKSQTSAIIKQHISFVNKVLPPCSMPPRSESDGSQLASAKKAKDPNAPKRALSGCAQFISPFHSPLPPPCLFFCCSASLACRYTLFVKSASVDIRAAIPGINAVEGMKTCGAN